MSHARTPKEIINRIGSTRKRTVLAVCLGSLISRAVSAQTPSTPVLETRASDYQAAIEEKPFDLAAKTENLGRLYKNDQNETIQELWFLGRYHGQYHWTEANTGETDYYETRRFRLGAQAKMFRKLTLHAQMVSGANIDPFYNGFTELFASWAFMPEFTLTVGQQKNRFTHDRITSSRYLNYLERSLITNQFNVEYTPGLVASGKIDKASYYTGVFTNYSDRDMGETFTAFDSGWSYIASGYYDLGKAWGLDSVNIAGQYIHSDANQNANYMNRFDNGVSGSLIMIKGRTSLIAELTAGIGSDQGNATGLTLSPTYFITPKWQIATRYQLAGSNNEQGLSPQKRYEKPSDFVNGDRYQAGYVGLNYYIAKHRLKLMNGIEYSNLSGQEAWTASSMIRLYWGPHGNTPFPTNMVLPLETD
jgi:hypothetical protein